MSQSLNPYAPPETSNADGLYDGDLPGSIEFRVTGEHQRYAERHYLLHQHSGGLTFLSVVAVFGGTATTIFLSATGYVPFLLGQAVLAGLTSLFYLAIVSRSKITARSKTQRFGLVPGTACELKFNQDDRKLTLCAGVRSHDWPFSRLSICPTLKGLIISPEPFLYVFVPKGTDFKTCNARAFRKRLAALIQNERTDQA